MPNSSFSIHDRVSLSRIITLVKYHPLYILSHLQLLYATYHLTTNAYCTVVNSCDTLS